MRARTIPSYSWFTVLGSAAFLACSWTWCIGMFFPVYLLRDYGPWSFPVFALPNIVGAASLAMVLSRPTAAAEYARTHATAVRLFSFVTVAFQWFFLVKLVAGLGLSWEGGGVLGLALVAMSLMERRGPDSRSGLRVSVVTLVFSLAMLAWFVPTIHSATPSLKDTVQWRGPEGLAWFAPVSVVGFMLCPYLDGTFLRVRERVVGAGGTAAFVIGFFGFFSLMLLFTLTYAGATLGAAFANGVPVGPQWADLPVRLHMGLQLGFTIGVHARPLAVVPTPGTPLLRLNRVVGKHGALIAAIVSGALAFASYRLAGTDTMTMSELIYRGFMAFYGVVFPAYVLAAGWPGRGRHGTPTAAPRGPQWIAWLAASAVGCACVWLAFVEGRGEFTLGWALAMAAAAVVGARSRRRTVGASTGAS